MTPEPCIASCYAHCMAQLVTRVDDDLAAEVDALVDEGVVASRSEAVRQGLYALLDAHRRRQIGQQIVAGYRAQPQTDEEVGWSDAATAAMIAEEPW